MDSVQQSLKTVTPCACVVCDRYAVRVDFKGKREYTTMAEYLVVLLLLKSLLTQLKLLSL